MNRTFLVSALAILLLLFVQTGCNKDASQEATNTNTEAKEAVADNADTAAAPAEAADANAAEEESSDAEVIAQAASDTNEFYTGLEKAATEAGDDCDKLGQSLTDYLNANKDAYIDSALVLEDDDDSADVAKADSIMDDDSAFKKALDKCADNEKVGTFMSAYIDVMLAVNE